MTGKIERLANAPRAAQVERKQVESATKTAAVSRTSSAPKNAFSNESPAQVESGTTGTHLAQSARPDALWGGSEKRGSS